MHSGATIMASDWSGVSAVMYVPMMGATAIPSTTSCYMFSHPHIGGTPTVLDAVPQTEGHPKKKLKKKKPKIIKSGTRYIDI